MITDQYNKILTVELSMRYQKYYDALRLKQCGEVESFFNLYNSGNLIGNEKVREDLLELDDNVVDYDPETVNGALVESDKSHLYDVLVKYPIRMTNLIRYKWVFDMTEKELEQKCLDVIEDTYFRIRGIDHNAIKSIYDVEWIENNLINGNETILDRFISNNSTEFTDNKYIRKVVFKGVKNYCEDRDVEKLEKYKEWLLKYYEVINTVPMVQMSKNDEIKDISILFDSNSVYNPKTKRFGFGNAGLVFLERFFPNLNRVQKKGIKHTIESTFYDPYRLRYCIKKAFRHAIFTNSRILFRMIRIAGTGYCTNFKPQVAKSIYEFFGKTHNCKVYDYAAGYAGRLLGAYTSRNVSEYIGVDVNTETVKYHQDLIKYLYENYPANNDVKTILCGSEEFIQKNPNYINYFDIAFSSPQYFDTEIYSHEATQSCNKFSNYELWVRKFYIPTILNAIDSLKIDGVFGMNIFEKLPALKKVCSKTALLKGYILTDETVMLLRTLPGGVGKGKKRDLSLISNGEPIWFYMHWTEALKRGKINEEQAEIIKNMVIKNRLSNKSILDDFYDGRVEPNQHLVD